MTTIGHPLRPGDPRRISDYELLGRLGGGGMGIVYAARAPGGRVVALKTVRGLGDADAEALARFGREMQAASSIESPHVAAVLAFRRDITPAFLVTEFVDGLDVRENVEEHGVLDPEACADLALGTARGLAALHARDIAHRDLTWSNVVLTAAGPVIVDLGIALRRDDPRLTSTGRIGSPAWMPPEAWAVDDDDVGDPRHGDVFQWGLLVAHAATGRHPFATGDARHGDVQLAIAVAGARDLDGVPPRLRGLVDRALAHAPADRPTAATLVAALTATPPAADPTAAPTADPTTDPTTDPTDDPTDDDVDDGATRAMGPAVTRRIDAAAHPRPPAHTPPEGAPPPGGAPTTASDDRDPGRADRSDGRAWEVIEFELGPDR